MSAARSFPKAVAYGAAAGIGLGIGHDLYQHRHKIGSFFGTIFGVLYGADAWGRLVAAMGDFPGVGPIASMPLPSQVMLVQALLAGLSIPLHWVHSLTGRRTILTTALLVVAWLGYANLSG